MSVSFPPRHDGVRSPASGRLIPKAAQSGEASMSSAISRSSKLRGDCRKLSASISGMKPYRAGSRSSTTPPRVPLMPKRPRRVRQCHNVSSQRTTFPFLLLPRR
jgi:hypothetical protein